MNELEIKEKIKEFLCSNLGVDAGELDWIL